MCICWRTARPLRLHPCLGRRVTLCARDHVLMVIVPKWEALDHAPTGRLATNVDLKEVNGGSKLSSFILAGGPRC